MCNSYVIHKKADDDNYYCCNANNVDKLFNQWSEWGACEITGNANANTCGCVNAGEDTCGRQIRKRELKCPEVRFRLNNNVGPDNPDKKSFSSKLTKQTVRVLKPRNVICQFVRPPEPQKRYQLADFTITSLNLTIPFNRFFRENPTIDIL